MNKQKKTEEENIKLDSYTTKDDSVNENGSSEVEIIADEETDESEIPVDDSVIKLEEQLTDKHNRLIRSMADMDNLRKRCRRDVEEALTKGRSDVLNELLPAVDSLDLALDKIHPSDGVDAILDGMKMVRKQFLTAMDRFGLKALKAVGTSFNPVFHEAISQIPSNEHAQGIVCEEVRKGYMLGDKLLRASMVVVSTGQVSAAVNPDDAPTNIQPKSSSKDENDDDEHVSGDDNV